jgi:hypothetical protein
MVKALMAGLQEQLDFKKLAEKHIPATLKQDLSQLDEKTQMIYQKLFIEISVYIPNHSNPLALTLMLMNEQTENTESAGLFVGTFLLPHTKSLIAKLNDQFPEAINNTALWTSN